HPLVRDCGENLAVGGVGRPPNPRPVAGEGLERLPGRHVPELDRLVVAGRRYGLAVGSEGRADRACVAFEGPHLGTIGPGERGHDQDGERSDGTDQDAPPLSRTTKFSSGAGCNDSMPRKAVMPAPSAATAG